MKRTIRIVCLIALTAFAAGCAAPARTVAHKATGTLAQKAPDASPIRLAAAEEPTIVDSLPAGSEDLNGLVATALSANPELNRLRTEYAAARDKVRYIGKLPDPKLMTNVFASPIETAGGSQRANLSLTQTIPWPERLEAGEHEAFCRAASLNEVVRARELGVRAEVKQLYYELYFFDRRVEINRATSKLIEALVTLANKVIGAGRATAGDVFLGTVEIAKLKQELTDLQQRAASTRARLNRLLNRPAETAVSVSKELLAAFPAVDRRQLLAMASRQQPELQAARLREQAAGWGVQVAQLQRVPDLTVGLNWFFTDDNRVTGVGIGQDAWSIGVGVNIPLWREKYDAMESEATRKQMAAAISIDDLVGKYDSVIADLWEQAKAADETVVLYRKTLIPQATRTKEADEKSYANGSVDFERVLQKVRRLLDFRVALERERVRLAIAVANLERAVAADLPLKALPPLPKEEDGMKPAKPAPVKPAPVKPAPARPAPLQDNNQPNEQSNRSSRSELVPVSFQTRSEAARPAHTHVRSTSSSRWRKRRPPDQG